MPLVLLLLLPTVVEVDRVVVSELLSFDSIPMELIVIHFRACHEVVLGFFDFVFAILDKSVTSILGTVDLNLFLLKQGKVL